jgi:ABC-type nitrate/sulfonate/bicarbonate transport system substrate-binding protein
MAHRDVRMSRRAALRGAAAVGLAGFGPAISPSSAQTGPAQTSPAILANTKLTVTGYYRGPELLVAMHKGFFAKERLDIDFYLVQLAPDHNRGLAEGRFPVTISSIDTMLARSTQEGIDFVSFMEMEEGLDVQLVVRPEIKSFEDLRGKLFAADPVDSNYDLIRNKIMRDHGVTEDQYRIDILGSSRHRAEAFAAGKVAAAMLAPPFTERALASGGVVLAEGADYVPNWPIACGWGLRRWLEANRSTVVRLVRAMASSTDWLLSPENREETIALLMREEKLPPARAENAYKMVVPKGMIKPESVRKNIELRIALGYYKPPHKPTEAFYDASFWSEATGLPPPAPAGLPRNAAPT